MNLKTYEADYMETKEALKAALKKRDAIDAEIASLDERKRALETLIEADYPHKGRYIIDMGMSAASVEVNVTRPQVTEAVRGILTASQEPLTSGEIHELLPKFGWKIESSANPWALIHGIGRRLVEQGFARETSKGGRRAWVKIRP